MTVAVGIGIASLFSALALRGRLEQGRASLTSARVDVSRGRTATAAKSFDRARKAFREGLDASTNLPLRLVGVIPLLGRTPDTLFTMAALGEELSTAGVSVAREIAALPGGVSDLGPKDGRIPLPALRGLTPVLHRARLVLEEATVRAEDLPTSWVIGPVAEARDELQEGLAGVASMARRADALLGVLPQLAGGEGTAKNYFVAPQNLAEARGTGGLIGNFGVMTITDGAMRVGTFTGIQVLPNRPPSEVSAPSAEYAALYDPFGGAGFWLNLNMTPDAPLAATLIENLYEEVRGQRLDGTIFIDLVALSNMLRATGPVRVPQLRATLTSDNVMQFVAEARYRGDFPNPQTAGPRLIADAVIRVFFSSADPEEALRALVESAAGGHIVVHARDARVQSALRVSGVAGEFASGDADFLGLAVSNAAANKVDYYMRRNVSYDIDLDADGRGQTRATVMFENLAPAGAKRSYSLGPASGLPLTPGENQSWTSFYCSPGCRLVGATMQGRPLSLRYHREMGLNRYSNYIRVRPEDRAVVRLDLEGTGQWQGDEVGGIYRVRVQVPPAARPATVTVTVSTPAGMNVSAASDGMTIDGSRATWKGAVSGRKDLFVRFGQPLPRRILTRVWSFLSRPLFRP